MPINNSGLQLVKNIPESIANSMLQPYPSVVKNIYGYFIFVTNIVLILFMIFAIYKHKQLSNPEKYWVLLCISSALILLLIITIITNILYLCFDQWKNLYSLKDFIYEV